MKNQELQIMRAKGQALPEETRTGLFYQLMCVVLSEAVEDYVGKTPVGVKKSMPKYLFDQSIIIEDLKSPRMVALTNGMSETIAFNLKNNAEEIAENLEKLSSEYAIIKVDIYDTPKFQ